MVVKRLLKIIGFLAIFVFLFAYTTDVFCLSSNLAERRFKEFYSQPINSLDAVYIGSSGVDNFWSSPLAWEEYGITVFPFSSDAQPTAAAKYLIKEGRKTQKNALYIIDLRAVRAPDISEGEIRKVTDNMRLSLNWYDAVTALTETANIPLKDRLPYYISQMKYHDRWSELTSADFTNEITYLKGSQVIDKTVEQKVLSGPTGERAPIPEFQQKVLTDLLDYCKQEKLNVLFIVSPMLLDKEAKMQYNYVGDEVKKYGFPFVNFSDQIEDMNLDLSTDFYEADHVNMKGQIKYTRYFAKYLVDHYSFSDKRSEASYASWDESYRNYLNTRLNKAKKLSDYLPLTADENYEVFLTVNGPVQKKLGKEVDTLLEGMGIELKSQKESYWAVLEGGKPVQDGTGTGKISKMSSVGHPEKDMGGISVNGTDYTVRKSGDKVLSSAINLVVYDKVLNEIVSAVAVNPQNGSVMK